MLIPQKGHLSTMFLSGMIQRVELFQRPETCGIFYLVDFACYEGLQLIEAGGGNYQNVYVSFWDE